MKLKFRVQSHSFHSEGKTRLELSGVDGTEGSMNFVRASTEAAKYPVGSTFTVQVGAAE